MADDDLTRLRHLLDQSTGILQEIAPKLGFYYQLLVEEQGIPPEQAIILVRHLQARYLGSNHPEEED